MKNKVLAFCFVSLFLGGLHGVIGMGYSGVFQLTEESLPSPVHLQAFTTLGDEWLSCDLSYQENGYHCNNRPSTGSTAKWLLMGSVSKVGVK
ncbi:MAG TPA: hypothetical protein PLQ80_10410 [Candidatus Syntrophosphaera sp.]|nr:hypothetical protein [Candidatus Syntrophosphaera sp.]